MTTNRKTKIRKDDHVIVTAGNDRGKQGVVLRVIDHKVVVQGVNVRKKHVKPTRTTKGGIIEREAPIDASNLRVCTPEGKPLKLSVKQNSEGQKELVYKDGSSEKIYRTLSRKKI